MNKATKVGTRSKPVKKAAAALASAVKPVKKRSKVSAAAVKTVKTRTAALSAAAVKKLSETEFLALRAALERRPISELTDAEWQVCNTVTLAEVEVLAAKAVKMIKAKRTVAATEKARKIALVEESLGRARRWGALSKCGAWGLKHPFGIMKIIDMKAVLR